ncbi:uncharacterized protein LOC143695356 [Agelaius phoeniceus]|uniref:uncharacterized protein LOC143695356 n=1 Tax=Agelaius phoeniceus TaxID=39638 RepID=UPI004054D9E9
MLPRKRGAAALRGVIKERLPQASSRLCSRSRPGSPTRFAPGLTQHRSLELLPRQLTTRQEEKAVPGKIQVGHQESFFTEKAVKHWNRLHEDVLESPSLEVLKHNWSWHRVLWSS